MKHDLLILIGGGHYSDGELNEFSMSRARRAILLYKSGRVENILCSGSRSYSQGSAASFESEAKLMAECLRSNGVPAERIFLEEESKDTFANAYFSRKFIESRLSDSHSLLVVSSDFHMPRTRYLFEKVFGSRRHLSFLPALSGLTPQERRRFDRRESRVLYFMKKFLDIIPSGQQDALDHFMQHDHPLYATKSMKISLRQWFFRLCVPKVPQVWQNTLEIRQERNELVRKQYAKNN